MLAQALWHYENNLCSCGCGQPARISQDERNRGLFSKQRVVCYARAELERGDKDSKPEPGEMRFVEFDLGWERTFKV